MLKKFLAAVLLVPVLCCSVCADVLYRGENDSIYRLTADSSGSLQSVLLNGDIDGVPKIVNVNGRELLVFFHAEMAGNNEGGYTETGNTMISVYETNNLSAPIASRLFTKSELPYSARYVMLEELQVWGNNILLPCINNTIAVFDPFTCTISERYTYPNEPLPDWVIGERGDGYGYPNVTVFGGKIYAAFERVSYGDSSTSSVSAAGRASYEYMYLVEMSSLGTITREFPELSVRSDLGEYAHLKAVDGKLYMNYSKAVFDKFTYTNSKDIYCFDGEINLASAKKIALPDGITPNEDFLICSDASGGIYLAGDGVIYHYDGSSVSLVYSAERISSIVYDKTLNVLFASVPYTTTRVINGMTVEVGSGKIAALRPSSSGSFSVLQEVKDAHLWGLIQGTTAQPSPTPTSGDNPPSVSPAPTSNDSRPGYNTNPPYYYDDQYYYDDPYYDDRDSGSSGGGGGCNSGFGFAVLAVLFMRRKGE